MNVSLFDQPVPFVAGSRTSHAAADQIRTLSPNLRERVYLCIVQNGPVNDEEIADLLEMNPSTQRPRRIELAEAGRIRPDGTRTTKSGRQAVAWRAA